MNLLLISILVPCCAQETKPLTLQLDFDLRAGLGSSGASRATDYQNALALNYRLNPVTYFRYVGGQFNAPATSDGHLRFDRFVTQEAALERQWKDGTFLQAGVVRLPFGLFDTRETYASGLINYPLLRGDYALQSVNWGVPGVGLKTGWSRIQIQAAAFSGESAGMWGNLNNTRGIAGRLQTYYRDMILGVSHWNGSQSSSLEEPGPRVTHVTGIDIRYTRPHLLLRGEFLTGTLAGEKSKGWYIDSYYHLPKYKKITLVARWEEFKPEADGPAGKQITLGTRYTLNGNWILALNWRSNNGMGYNPSWTPATAHGGDVLFQVYRKLTF